MRGRPSQLLGALGLCLLAVAVGAFGAATAGAARSIGPSGFPVSKWVRFDQGSIRVYSAACFNPDVELCEIGVRVVATSNITISASDQLLWFGNVYSAGNRIVPYLISSDAGVCDDDAVIRAAHAKYYDRSSGKKLSIKAQQRVTFALRFPLLRGKMSSVTIQLSGASKPMRFRLGASPPVVPGPEFPNSC